MAKQVINTGAAPNDGTGDTIRVAFTKTNNNFTELYNSVNTAAILFGQVNAFANATSRTANGAAWAANSGIRQINTFTSNNSNTIFANEDNSVIACNLYSIGSNVDIILPDDAYNGKLYTIKNINTASYLINITANTANSIEVIGGSGSFANSTVIAQTGQYVTFICDNGIYRIIG